MDANPNQEQVDRYLRKLASQYRFSLETCAQYRHLLGAYVRMLGAKELSRTDRNDLKDFLLLLADTNSPITLNHIRSTLKVFYDHLIRIGAYAHVNPAVKIELRKVKKLLPVAIIGEEVERMYQLLEEDQKLKVRDVTMFDVFIGTGIRTSELANLEYRDYEVKEGCGFFRVRAGKGNKDRDVVVPDATREKLEQYLVGRRRQPYSSNYIFVNDKGRRFTRQHIYLIMEKMIGKMYGRKRGAHRLRHTFATLLLDRSHDLKAVQLQLGHASAATTQVYLHNATERLKKVFDAAHPKA
jgi:site-specific recombinase XerD